MFFCDSPLSLSETKCSRNCPATTPTVSSPVDSIHAGIHGGRAHPFFGYAFPVGFSPAFQEFPTVDLALLFHNHATEGLKGVPLRFLRF